MKLFEIVMSIMLVLSSVVGYAEAGIPEGYVQEITNEIVELIPVEETVATEVEDDTMSQTVVNLAEAEEKITDAEFVISSVNGTSIEYEVKTKTEIPTEPEHVHDYVADRVQAPTCTSAGYTYYVCECGAECLNDFVEQLGHEYSLENAIIVEPTAYNMGYTRYQCSNCDSSYDTNYVDYMSTIVFYDVNETVWANSAVNVRQGPGTDFTVIGGLEWSETVTRIGITDNGWSKVIYNGEEAYISSDYLQTFKPEPPFDGSTPSEEVSQKLRNSGATGILYIPSMGMEPVNVYLYRGTAVKSLQGIADARNSAYMVGVYMPNDSSNHHIEFGDHVNHNFSVLKNIPVGTMAYFNMGDKVVRFKCVETISHCSMNQYFAGCYAEGGMIKTTCCSGNGRTVNRWVVTADSDLTFEEFYSLAGQGERVYWNT